MFGYVMPTKAELKIKHYELYKAFYCGVCVALKKRYGQKSRLLLNYDTTFFAIFFSALQPEYSISKKLCAYKMKKNFIATEKSIDLAADLNVILAYYKMIDDKNDEKRLVSKMGELLYRRDARKAYDRQCELREIIDSMAQEVELVEQANRNSSMEVSALPFSNMMSALAEYGMNQYEIQDDEQRKYIREFFTILGKLIYIYDAVDDYSDDVKSGSFNPIKSLLNDKYSFEDYCKDVETIVHIYLMNLGELFDKIEFKDINLKCIIENVVFSGMNEKYIRIWREANGSK